ncbi:hypothetical protein FOZ61_003807 [Perkinsus olseni]|uniref:Uncharacterized protein n=1 Tax=Perkinsus olseni TaxID=32597 RepID=A0A7J6LN86_PEROL|nr:hypothetical protein FOZ61_003807 [Perkinsus olseni]
MGTFSRGLQAGARFAKARGSSVWAKAYNANFSRTVASVTLPRLCGESPIQGYPEQMRSASFVQAGGNQELLGPAGSVSLLTLEALEETAELLQTLLLVCCAMQRCNHVVRFGKARGSSLWAIEYNRRYASACRKLLLATGECPREGFAEQHRGGELVLGQALTGSDSSPVDGIDLNDVTEEQLVAWNIISFLGGGISSWSKELGKYNRCFTSAVSRNVIAVMGESPAQGFAEQRRGGELVMGQALSGSDSQLMDGVDMEDLTDEQIVSWNMITGFGPGVGAVPPDNYVLRDLSSSVGVNSYSLFATRLHVMGRSSHVTRFAKARGSSAWALEYNRRYASACRKVLVATGECPREGFAEQHRGGELVLGQALTGSDSSPVDGIDLTDVTEEQLVAWNIISFLGGGISSWSKEYNANFHTRAVTALSTLPRIVGEAPMQGFAEQIPPMVSTSISSEMTSAGGGVAKTIPEDELEEMIALAFQLSSKILTTSVVIDNNVAYRSIVSY